MISLSPNLTHADGKHKHIKKGRKSLEKALRFLDKGKVYQAKRKVGQAIRHLKKGEPIYGGHKAHAIKMAEKAKHSRNPKKMGRLIEGSIKHLGEALHFARNGKSKDRDRYHHKRKHRKDDKKEYRKEYRKDDRKEHHRGDDEDDDY